ncbi:unnamed protein product [Sphagnum balticum]
MATRKPDLTKITSQFGRAYTSAEKATATKARVQAKFFDAINSILEDQIRKQKVVEYIPTVSGSPETWVWNNYPGWRFVRIVDESNIVIEEDPQFMKYSFVNKENGMVYGRTSVQAGDSLDDEKLRHDNPYLWKQITEWPEPWYSLIAQFAQPYYDELCDPDEYEETLDKYLEESGLQRTLKSPDKWTDDQFREVRKYIIPGKISTRLVAPREAKEEELK